MRSGVFLVGGFREHLCRCHIFDGGFRERFYAGLAAGEPG